MKKLLVILILGMLSCKKEIPNIVIPAPQTTIVNTITQTKKINYQLFFNFDSLQRVSGYEVMNGPIVIDFDNNGRYDIVVNRRNMSRTQTTYVYEMLNPIVILDNGQIKELPNLNHLFQECKTGSPQEYSEIEQTFSPLAFTEILNWIQIQTKK